MNSGRTTSSPPNRTARLRLLLFGAVAVASVGIGFLAFDPVQSQVLVKRGGYVTISLTFAWALFATWRIRRLLMDEFIAATRGERWRVLAVVAVCAAVAALTAPFAYKVLYDEMVLQATAWNMHHFREVSAVLRAYTIDGVFMPLDKYLDKRPFFFPYLVSLVHDLFGYRERNAFMFNLALMPVILTQVYWLARRLATPSAALAAMVSLGTLSLLAHNATGSGMEMLNLAMILLTMQFAVIYLESPDEPRLAALILSGILLAQSRYESSLYIGPVALVAIEGWRRARRPILPLAAILAPALLIPYALHNTYLSGTPLLWELKDDAHARFDPKNVWPNLQHAAYYLFSTSRLMTNSLWLSVAGALALGLALVRLWMARRTWKTAQPHVVVLVLFGAAILANLSLLMFYYWGQLDDPIVGRLSLPTLALLALVLAYAIGSAGAWTRRLVAVAWIGAGVAWLWSGLVANEIHSKPNTLHDEIAWELRWVEQRPPGDRLILTNKSALPWMLSHVPAIAIEQARARVEQLRFQIENNTFREILVFQKYRPTTAAGDYVLDPADRLPDWFKLELVAEKRFGTRLDRVSRLVQIGSPPSEPATGGN